MILNDVVLNQFLVRFGGNDDADHLTERTIRQIQSDGICFVGGAKWRGRQALRVSVSSWMTDEEQGRIAADAIAAAWRTVQGQR